MFCLLSFLFGGASAQEKDYYIRTVPSWGEGGLGRQLPPPLEIRQSDYNALLSVISTPPLEIRETISALPPLLKNSRYGAVYGLFLQQLSVTTEFMHALCRNLLQLCRQCFIIIQKLNKCQIKC